ncbi:MAG: YgiQ family radical SAM protein [Synergistetes bacterium]|nr:YgiQ family radical SAM protein [Synergistota bacterium]MCX8127908.1 YgiQ family radical SAM protein [Synergistota bacterium]MDW8192170.1 YgiQ family radical SAM protein [Synergistota bacterium]
MLDFLPITIEEAKKKGWDELDVIIVTGDSYIDHPSFGAAVIGRILEFHGFRVGILPQPDWKDKNTFKALGKPRLFFGITAGSVDSLVANYTPNKRKRESDAYTPDGKPGRRPDRATIVYANVVHEIYPDVPIILGGIEASLRRFSHYDYWEDRVRHSILLDARAKILVYGMGEKQVVEIAKRLSLQKPWYEIYQTPGIVYSLSEKEFAELFKDRKFLLLPSFEDVSQDKEAYYEFQQKLIRGLRERLTLVQKDGKRYVIQNPPTIYTTEDLDLVYSLPFKRLPHPSYKERIPALDTVITSITSHRGCFGSCTFCSLNIHQGWQVISRSQNSILKEAFKLTSHKSFKGTISDIGGPTANMYQIKCKLNKIPGTCLKRECLFPEVCEYLELDYSAQLDLLRKVKDIPKIKHVFIASGIRYDLVLENENYLRDLIKEGFIGGHLSAAPEHVKDHVLEIMKKPSFKTYEKFVEIFERETKSLDKELYIIPYFISGHPGATIKDAWDLAIYVKNLGHYLEQIQDYTPLPLTVASCAFYTGFHTLRKEKIYVPKSYEERRLQRALVQWRDRKNKEFLLKNRDKIPFPLERIIK